MKKTLCLLASSAALFSGCMTMKVEPIKIEVTVKVQVEKDLSNFFDDIDSAPVKPESTTTTQGDAK